MNQTENAKKRKQSKSWVLLLLLLLSFALLLSVGGITLAKYISKNEGSGTASVAKWGYKITADASKLFGSNYKFDTDASKVTADTTGLTVKASDAGNRVAPGTTGSLKFTIGGTAEVKSKLTVNFEATKDVYLTVTDKNDPSKSYTYTPVVWTLTKEGTAAPLATGTLNDVAAHLNGLSKVEIAAGETPTDVNGNYTLSWAWKFENSTVPAGLTGVNADTLDTVLGWLAEGLEVNDVNNEFTYAGVTDIAFTFTIAAEQLEK